MATTRKAPASNVPRPKQDPAAMEILHAILSSQNTEKEITIEVEGMDLVLGYKELSWMGKSRCISKATQIVGMENGQTNASFRIDIYNKECIKEMITKSPFPITDQIIEKLPAHAGAQLEKIIPNPWGDEGEQEETKKVQSDSSEEMLI